MFDAQMSLYTTFLGACRAELAADPSASEPWARAARALGDLRTQEPELAAAIDARDLVALDSLFAQWSSGKRHLPLQDREVLKRAMTAFRKSLKVTRLDAESSIGGGPMSGGRNSGISGITPPPRYPREVWEELARQKRLIHAGRGVYELPPEG